LPNKPKVITTVDSIDDGDGVSWSFFIQVFYSHFIKYMYIFYSRASIQREREREQLGSSL